MIRTWFWGWIGHASEATKALDDLCIQKMSCIAAQEQGFGAHYTIIIIMNPPK